MEIGQILSYDELRAFSGFQIQHGMNYSTPKGGHVFLMSMRENAPYEDWISEDGSLVEYEGHNQTKSLCADPERTDQPRRNKSGSLTKNGKFEEEALKFKNHGIGPCKISIFNKVKDGIWTFCGVFSLIDVSYVQAGPRKVFRFKLQLAESNPQTHSIVDLRHDRMIPGEIQAAVFKRDQGRCVKCGSTENLHFDHILPYSKGGSSKKVENIQILCAKHNLSKGNRFV
ncbi:HNH endonuclease [Bdellovibrio bacteriovorus]|uniref:HNH endonuclease n=1 Tax=Bdellovibrio bacteriovorus TaxID=959 RepID=UPI003A811DBD